MKTIEEICAHSFRNFHSPGLDYLCLHRSPEVTIKAYFFDGDTVGGPEIVVPHNHRYGFTTTVLKGGVTNRCWEASPVGLTYQEFDYLTPLNGGDGFHWKREVRLRPVSDLHYLSDETYLSRRTDIHTLAEVEPNTVLLLTQFADEMSINDPTQAFRAGLGHETPSLEGRFDEMTPDYARELIRRLHSLGWCSPIAGESI